MKATPVVPAPSRPPGPCDIYGAASTPCVAAGSILLRWNREVPRLAWMIHVQQRGIGWTFENISVDLFRARHRMTIHFEDDISPLKSCFRRSRIAPKPNSWMKPSSCSP